VDGAEALTDTARVTGAETATSAWRRWRGTVVRYHRRHQRQGDAALALGASLWHVLAWVSSAAPNPKHPLWANLVALSLPTLPLFWRRTHPMWTFLAVGAGYLTWYFVAGPDMRGQIAIVFVGIALYSVARYIPPPRSLIAAGGMAVLLALPDLYGLSQESGPVLSRLMLGSVVLTFLLAIPVCVWLLGWGQRRLRDDADQLRALARQLRAERDLNARRAVLTERARIARDLHDVVAHHVSAIAVLARTAEVLFDDDPSGARGSLGLLGGTADTALTDMRRLVGILNTDSPRSDLAPEASLDHLDQLTRALEGSGCEVLVERHGSTGGLSASVESSAYRIIQEALTNVMKHAGPAKARIVLRRTTDTLSIVVENGPPTGPHESMGGTGLGLIGLRERAALFGGTLTAGPSGAGGWSLAATLPLADR
jgi:signal transduction histidine kinase